MPMSDCEACGMKMITDPNKPHPECLKCKAMMKKAFDTAWTDLVLKAKPCPKCGARSGEPCELDPSMDASECDRRRHAMRMETQAKRRRKKDSAMGLPMRD
jgi:hypothetical protein|tara:strand:+ start:231 stop:533 length:303 start_codon:yes stop_codon:yes gene_type:complete